MSRILRQWRWHLDHFGLKTSNASHESLTQLNVLWDSEWKAIEAFHNNRVKYINRNNRMNDLPQTVLLWDTITDQKWYKPIRFIKMKLLLVIHHVLLDVSFRSYILTHWAWVWACNTVMSEFECFTLLLSIICVTIRYDQCAKSNLDELCNINLVNIMDCMHFKWGSML